MVQMYMNDPTEEFDDVSVDPATRIVLAVALALTLYLGVFQARVLEWATQSAVLN